MEVALQGTSCARKRGGSGGPRAELLSIHTELWALMVLALKPKQPFSISQHDPLAGSLGNLLVLLLKLDSRLSQKIGRGRERRRNK